MRGAPGPNCITSYWTKGGGAGYPSLTRIDDAHIGIVYEGSQAHLVFEKFALQELVDK
jgi:sialidase-1